MRDTLLALTTTCLLGVATAAAAPETTHGRAALAQRIAAEAGIRGSIIDLAVDPAPGAPLVVDVTIEDELHTLELVPHDVRAPGYRLLVQVADGSLVEHEPGPLRTYRGSVLGAPGSRAFAHVDDDGLHAMVDVDGLGAGHRHWIEPVAALIGEAAPGEHLVYRDDGVECPGGTCAVEEHHHDAGDLGSDAGSRGASTTPEPIQTRSDGGVAGADCMYTAQIAFDADWEYFDGPGQNSVTNTENRITGIINSVSNQWESQVDIEFVISAIIVRSSPSDPYSSTSDAGVLLNEFRSHWNTFQTGIERDLAQLFTGRNASGSVIGLASLSVVCTDSAYSLVENIGSFACRTDLSSHEIGHNWSAQHCSCPFNTMNSGLACANNFTQASRSSIIAHRNSRPCIDVNCPPDNDDCADAITIGSGDTGFNTTLSTLDGPQESLCGAENNVASDIWYAYAAPCTGDITFSLCDSTFDTRMAIYDGLACPTGSNTALACNDDACGDNAALTIAAVEDQELLIRIGGSFAAQGTGILSVSVAPDCIAIPGNDTCASAVSLAPGVNFFVTSGAASEGPEESGVCDIDGNARIDKDIWFRHIAQCSGELTIDLCGSAYNTKLAIYGSGCPTGPDEALACNDDFCGVQSQLTYPVSQGSIYRIRVGGFDGDAGFGQIELTCQEVSGCDGDTNNDQIVDVNDLNNVILDWGTGGSANGGDITGSTPGSPPDGAVDVNDLNAVIVNWGVCP